MAADVITKDMNLLDVIKKYPNTVEVFFKHGLGCIGCAAAQFESIEQGATAHGLDVDELVKDLNEAASKESEKETKSEEDLE